MRKTTFIILVFLSTALLLVRFGTTVLGRFGLSPKAGIRVEANIPSQVSLDQKLLGKTPFQKEDLGEGEHLVELTSDTGSWRGYVKLISGTLTVVSRDLAATDASSSGEIISLEKGQGATITSNPSGAKVSIDGKEAGETPLSVPDLSLGEHLFLISHPNYLDRSIRAAVTAGYNLNLNADLAISEADLSQLPTLSTPATAQVIVKQTPTGFLNIRSEGSLNGDLVERVSSGDTLTLEEEGTSWDKVKLPDGKEGYASTQYLQKKAQ